MRWIGLPLIAVILGVAGLMHTSCALALENSTLSDLTKASFTRKGFIRVQGEKFVDEECKEFFFTGWNSWALMETAGWIVQLPPEASQVVDGKNPIEWMFDEAQKVGFNMLRLFGHGVDPGFIFMKELGVYDENMFKGMDYILDEAGKRGIRLIISFMTNWKDVDSKSQFMKWFPKAKSVDEFWTRKKVREAYKEHMAVIVNRENTFNGLVYKDDPTIFAWNIFNEVRCLAKFCTPETIVDWTKEMVQFLKKEDPNHLITHGQEGFYGWGCPTGKTVNPLPNSHIVGQDFIRDHSFPEIDFAAIHLWPNNWEIDDEPSFPLDYIKQHAKDAKKYIKKPLILEEFGIEAENTNASRAEVRDPVFSAIFAEVIKNIEKGGALRAAMFWEWFLNEKGEPSIHGVTRDHTTWEILKKHGQAIAKLNAEAEVVKKCKPGKDSAVVKSENPNNRFDIEGCCDADCNAMYADLKGEIFQESLAATPGDCCRSCKFANIRAGKVVCTNWSWCPCGKCNNAKKGTCRLKTQKNPFYPRAWIQGKGQPWVSGVVGQFLPEWRCQPKGKCAFDEDCKNFAKSMKCLDSECGPVLMSVESRKILEFNVNGNDRPYNATHPPKITTATDCCAACKATPHCNAWKFCHSDEGCPVYRKPCSEFKDELGLGPYDECSKKNPELYPRLLCTLMTVDISKVNVRHEPHSPYVSGLLRNRPVNLKAG